MDILISLAQSAFLIFVGIWFIFFGFAIFSEEHVYSKTTNKPTTSAALIIFLTGVGTVVIIIGFSSILAAFIRQAQMMACG